MATKKTIAVVGATGAQGGGLAQAILNDPNGPFQVRALTRTAGSDKARELAALSEASGEVVRYDDVPPEVYRGFGFPGADDLGNMFQFKRDFNDEFCAARDPATARALDPSVQDFGEWLARNQSRIPLD